MAITSHIPIKSDKHQHSGPLGIMHNRRARSTEIEALFPQRQDRERQYTFQPPTYMEAGEKHYMVWCPACAEWQRRGAFYADSSRTNGLRGWCKTCDNEKRAQRRRGRAA
jgi:hypothetical protein